MVATSSFGNSMAQNLLEARSCSELQELKIATKRTSVALRAMLMILEAIATIKTEGC